MAQAPAKKKNALKGKGGLVMTGLLILLGVWLFVDFKVLPAPRDPDALPLVADYVHLRAADVARVEVKRPDGGFTLEKKDGTWSFAAPRAFRANSATVDAWLKGLLDDATVSRTIESTPSDLSAYGLDRPAAELVLTSRRGDTRTLQTGQDFRAPKETAAGDSFYARETRDGRLFMLGSTHVDEISKKKIDDLRDKRLVELGEEKDVRKIAIRRAAGALEVERRGNDRWELTQPFQAPAEKFDVESLLSQLRSAEAESFAADDAADLAQYGLDNPRVTLEVTDKKGTRAVLFGKAAPGDRVYTARRGEKEVTLVSKFTFDSLDKKPADLRERDLITLESEKIKSVEIRNSHGTIRLQKMGGNEWELADSPDPKQKKAKGDTVQRVLDSARAPAFKHVEENPGDLGRYGLNQPTVTVTINDGAGTSQVLRLGKQVEGGNYYARGVPNAVFEVQPFVFSDLNLKPDAFKAEAEAAKK